MKNKQLQLWLRDNGLQFVYENFETRGFAFVCSNKDTKYRLVHEDVAEVNHRGWTHINLDFNPNPTEEQALEALRVWFDQQPPDEPHNYVLLESGLEVSQAKTQPLAIQVPKLSKAGFFSKQKHRILWDQYVSPNCAPASIDF